MKETVPKLHSSSPVRLLPTYNTVTSKNFSGIYPWIPMKRRVELEGDDSGTEAGKKHKGRKGRAGMGG
jgi:hypothetical protein